MAEAELEPKAIKTDKLISRIEQGDIKIPAFQRGFVWTQEQVIQLLDSMYRNYPIGSVLLWVVSEIVRATASFTVVNSVAFQVKSAPNVPPSMVTRLESS